MADRPLGAGAELTLLHERRRVSPALPRVWRTTLQPELGSFGQVHCLIGTSRASVQIHCCCEGLLMVPLPTDDSGEPSGAGYCSDSSSQSGSQSSVI